MRYLTHEFAHGETAERARRWLIQAGIAPGRIRVNHQGVPRLTVAAEASEVDGIELVIHAAERCDPDGLPGLWDLPHVHDEMKPVIAPIDVTPPQLKPSTFALAWHDERVDDSARKAAEVDTEIQREHRETRP